LGGRCDLELLEQTRTLVAPTSSDGAVKFFVAPGEDRQLDNKSRLGLRGDFIELSDGVTHYELTGPEHGQLVVMAPGLTIPLFYWDDAVARLHACGLRTLTYSAYGRGYSDRVRGRYDEALFVRQLTALVEVLGVDQPAHLVGTSMGALIAMAYVCQVPHGVATLTLIGPAGLEKPPSAQRLLTRSDVLTTVVAQAIGRCVFERRLGHNVSDPQQASNLAAMVHDSYRCEGSIYAFFSTLQNFPLFERTELYRHAGTLGVPTLLMWGRDDRVTPIAALETARETLHPRECHVIDCGHMAPFERPGEVADNLARFAATYTDRLKYDR
jgi:pimeloyl-ACP methyl ester carboxylesterase